MCLRQKKNIKRRYECFTSRVINRSKLRCYGAIRPNEGSPLYKVQIDYIPGYTPTVKVLSPDVKMTSKTHVYRGGDLCLFYPKDDPWKEAYLISEKIIPWTSEWLLYYELFLISGKWEGPEAPHEAP